MFNRSPKTVKLIVFTRCFQTYIRPFVRINVNYDSSNHIAFSHYSCVQFLCLRHQIRRFKVLHVVIKDFEITSLRQIFAKCSSYQIVFDQTSSCRCMFISDVTEMLLSCVFSFHSPFQNPFISVIQLRLSTAVGLFR